MRLRILTVTTVSALALTMTACGPGGGGGDAADYPSRDIEMLVGFGAGGLNDATARRFAASLEEELGENVLVVNRPGGGGVLASTEGANAAPDGYTLLFAPTGAFTSGMLQQQVSYDFSDFRSIQPVAENGFLIAVPADSPFRTLADLENAEGRLTYSNFGIGHPTHLVGAAIAERSGIDAEAISYDSSPDGLQAIVNGAVDFGVQDVNSTVLARLESGELRPLAISSQERLPALPDAPTVVEEGFENATFTGSQALAVPAETPEEIVGILEEAASAAVEDPEFTEFLESNAQTVPDVDGAAWFEEHLPAERDRFEEMYERLGIGE
ncbi:Bug family tripartite tricarboxylate transporter substrate binding protein [Kocuria sp. M1R5S2]|uniref:Bug family tripartite tricarboxylate transporter substrate binding protein n=1 Tax=Kocuria rhizosphaerae TaxID=3376285 RepID=UPI0037B70083